MEIALLTDSHWGVRSDHFGFLDYFERFHADIFFPILEKRGIKKIIHLGDIVDDRKSLNYLTASRLKTHFLDRLVGYDVKMIAGNHDVFYKSTNEINALQAIIADRYPNIQLFTEPEHVMLEDYYKPVLFVPWINRENEAKTVEIINSSYADLCFGHLELIGFEMQIGSFAEDGLDPSLFDKFNKVFSGHYHHKSTKGNIHYLGAPYEMTWADYADPRGFHIYNIYTGQLEFIQNPYCMFHKILYNEQSDMMKTDFSQYAKRYVKVIITNKLDSYAFDTFIEQLEKVGPYDLQIVEDVGIMIDEDALAFEASQDTLAVLNNYVNSSNTTVDKAKLSKLLSELYREAQLIQV